MNHRLEINSVWSPGKHAIQVYWPKDSQLVADLHTPVEPISPFYSLWLSAASLQPSAYLAVAAVLESWFSQNFPFHELLVLQTFFSICSFEPLVFPGELKHLKKVRTNKQNTLHNQTDRGKANSKKEHFAVLNADPKEQLREKRAYFTLQVTVCHEEGSGQKHKAGTKADGGMMLAGLLSFFHFLIQSRTTCPGVARTQGRNWRWDHGGTSLLVSCNAQIAFIYNPGPPTWGSSTHNGLGAPPLISNQGLERWLSS